MYLVYLPSTYLLNLSTDIVRGIATGGYPVLLLKPTRVMCPWDIASWSRDARSYGLGVKN